MKKEQIKAAAALKGITLSELAAALGTSKQNLSNKAGRGRLTDQELFAIAQILECKYICCFEFDRGGEKIRI